MIVDSIKINPEMVAYAEALSNYTVLHLSNGKVLVSSYWLSYVSTELLLVRISRSRSVNLNHVKQITADEVEMKSGQILKMSRSRAKELKKVQ